MNCWPRQPNVLLWLLAFFAAAGSGCASYQWPHIDPTGQSLLIWPQQQAPLPVAPPLYADPCAPPVVTFPGAPLPSPNVPASPPVTAPIVTAPPPTSQPLQPAEPIVSILTTGPGVATVGQTLTYRVDVTNTGSVEAQNVVITQAVIDGLQYLSSNPPATASGGPGQWTLGNLAPQQSKSIQVSLRADRPGAFKFCCSVAANSARTIQHCTNTVVSPAASAPVTPPASTGQIELRIEGPERGQVGQDVQFQISITNRGATPATGLVITDALDQGLQHAQAESDNRIQREIVGAIAPGATETIGLKLRLARSGTLRQVVTITGDNGINQSTTAWIVAADAVSNPAQPSVQLTISGPQRARVGDVVEFVMEVRNTGTQPIANLSLVNTFDPSLNPEQAAQGYVRLSAGKLKWEISKLEPQAGARYRINFLCIGSTPRACSSAEVTGASGAVIADEACMEILARDAAGNPPAGSPVGGQ